MTRLPRTLACLFHLGAGFALWSSCFVVLYGLLSLGCEAGGGAWLRAVLAGAWLLHLAVLVALLAWQWRTRPGRGLAAGRFAPPPALHPVAVAASAVALLATVWIGWPVLALPPCAGGEFRSAVAGARPAVDAAWSASRNELAAPRRA